MNDIRNILKIARSRLGATAFLSRLHVVALAAAGLVLAAVVVSKLIPAATIPWLWTGPALALATLLTACIWWSRKRPTELQVAIEVDDRLDLREKLSTALHVSNREDAFARASVEDAVLVARDARTREAVKRRFAIECPQNWWITPLLVLVALFGGFVIPAVRYGDDQSGVQTVQFVPKEVTEQLEAAVEKIKENKDLEKELSEVLKDLNADALDPEALKTPEGAKREAIKKLSDLSEKLKEIEDQKAKTKEAFQKAMEQLKSPSLDGPGKELADAMKAGDFEAAKQAVEKMMAMAQDGQMSKDQAQQMAQQMQNIAEQLQQMAQQQKALEEALKDAGLDPNLAQNPQQLQQALQNNQQLNQQQKQQLQQMAQAQQQAQGMCQGMAQAMGQMAQAMGQGNQNPGQQMAQGGQQMQQMLNDLQNMQAMMKQAQAMANALQGQCQQMGQGLGQCQNPGHGPGAFGGPGQGRGGQAPVTQTPIGLQADQVKGQNPNADVIARTLFQGDIIKGESTVEFREVAKSVAESHSENVEDDQLPVKYRDAVKEYFGEMGKTGSGTADNSGTSGRSSSEGD